MTLRNDKLYISDEVAHLVTPTYSQLKIKYPNLEKYRINNIIQGNINFYNNTKNEKGYRINRQINTLYSTTYGIGYAMNIIILLGNQQSNDSGQFQYYIAGNSGDSEMHGKNMIRATRECNLNFMIKLYPIVKYIKNFYKKLKNKEAFFDIIKNEVIKNPSISKYGIPEELQEELGHYELAQKYNLL